MKKYKSFRQIWQELEQSESFEAEKKILEFTTELYQLMKDRKISKKELAKRLNTSQAYVTKIFRGNANFTIQTMTRLVKALDGELHIHITPKEQQVARWFKVIDGGKSEDHIIHDWSKSLKVESVSQSGKLLEVA